VRDFGAAKIGFPAIMAKVIVLFLYTTALRRLYELTVFFLHSLAWLYTFINKPLRKLQ
jgi:hypothetical protein